MVWRIWTWIDRNREAISFNKSFDIIETHYPLNSMLPRTLLFTLGLLAMLSVHAIAAASPTLGAIGINPDLRPGYAPGSRGEMANPGANIEDKYGTQAVSQIIGDIALVFIQISGVIAIYFIVTSGLTYVKAFGREEELGKAKKGLIWSIVGLVVIISAYAIVQNVLRITLTVDESAIP